MASGNRICALDYARVVTILMIMLCHYLLFSDLDSGAGRYLGGVGTIIFFLISAFIYGLKYFANHNEGLWGGEQSFNIKRFAPGRVVKIGSSVWPFLALLTTLFLLFKVQFSWFDTILNFFFMGYLGKLPGNGHLWFITVLMVCYLEVILLLKVNKTSRSFPYILLVFSVIAVIVGESLGIPSNAFIILGLYGFIFLKSKWFYEKAKAMRWWMAAIIALLNIGCLIWELRGLFEYSRTIHFLLCGFCGLTLLALMLRYLPEKRNAFVSFLSGISFELYLVHHTLCEGPFMRVGDLPFNHIVNFLFLVVISLVLAIGLNYLAKKVAGLFERVVR